MSIFFFTSLLFGFLTVLTAVDAFSASLNLLPWFNGLRWLRIHLITLGVLTNAVFGLAPVLAAAFSKLPKPKTRLDIWVLLNSGILALLVGIPLVNQTFIILGGGLVALAAILLMVHLRTFKSETEKTGGINSRYFYFTGLAYLLVGIYVGTGLWLGWNQALHMAVPIEVHIHANNWGFLSLVFAGLLIDLFPRISGHELAYPNSIKPIFWMMTLGTLGLILGPWFQNTYVLVPGLLIHLAGTIWMALNILIPLRKSGQIKEPGYLHLLLSYVWILAPILVAPMILLKVPGFPGIGIEQNAPQALIYGWALQFSFALLPYLFEHAFVGEKEAALGGNWFSIAAVNLGSALLWASIFAKDIQTTLHGLAYLLWGASILPILSRMWAAVRTSVEKNFEDHWSSGD